MLYKRKLQDRARKKIPGDCVKCRWFNLFLPSRCIGYSIIIHTISGKLASVDLQVACQDLHRNYYYDEKKINI